MGHAEESGLGAEEGLPVGGDRRTENWGGWAAEAGLGGGSDGELLSEEAAARARACGWEMVGPHEELRGPVHP